MSSTTQLSHVNEAYLTTTSLPPPYEPNEIELKRLSTQVSNSSLPQYDAVSPSSSSATVFQPTTRYQVETRGHPWMTLPLPPKPHPISIYAVNSDGIVGEKSYESIRLSRGSGNCVLYDTGSGRPVATTTYRFGPGRPPKMRLLKSSASADLENLAENSELGEGEEEFEIISLGCATRAVSIRTHLGTFHWRHGSREEKKALRADSLLILEQITTVALEGGKQEHRARKVAHFIRNDEFRTEGSGRSTAGNGGRLELDLRQFEGGDSKGRDREQMESFAVSGLLCMLKREVDRRRMHQAFIIAGAASGGS